MRGRPAADQPAAPRPRRAAAAAPTRHDGQLHAELSQLADRRRRVGPQPVGDHEHCREPAAHHDADRARAARAPLVDERLRRREVGLHAAAAAAAAAARARAAAAAAAAACRRVGRRGARERRRAAAARAADAARGKRGRRRGDDGLVCRDPAEHCDLDAADCPRHAAPGDLLHARRAAAARARAARGGVADDRRGDGVRRLALERGGGGEHGALLEAAERAERLYFERALRERASLVEGHRLEAAEELQVAAALDEDALGWWGGRVCVQVGGRWGVVRRQEQEVGRRRGRSGGAQRHEGPKPALPRRAPHLLRGAREAGDARDGRADDERAGAGADEADERHVRPVPPARRVDRAADEERERRDEHDGGRVVAGEALGGGGGGGPGRAGEGCVGRARALRLAGAAKAVGGRGWGAQGPKLPRRPCRETRAHLNCAVAPRLALLRRLDQRAQPRDGAVARRRVDAHRQRGRAAVDRARERARAGRLRHRAALAGQHRLVDRAAAGRHRAVHRHAVARAHQHQVSGHQLRRGDAHKAGRPAAAATAAARRAELLGAAAGAAPRRARALGAAAGRGGAAATPAAATPAAAAARRAAACAARRAAAAAARRLEQQRRLGLHPQHALERARGAAYALGLEPLCQREKEDERASLAPIAQRHRARAGDHHEHVDIQHARLEGRPGLGQHRRAAERRRDQPDGLEPRRGGRRREQRARADGDERAAQQHRPRRPPAAARAAAVRAVRAAGGRGRRAVAVVAAAQQLRAQADAIERRHDRGGADGRGVVGDRDQLGDHRHLGTRGRGSG
jgi:hypothetical protein